MPQVTKLVYVYICRSYAEKTVASFFSGHGVHLTD